MSASQIACQSRDHAIKAVDDPRFRLKPDDEFCALLVESNLLRETIRHINDNEEFKRLNQNFKDIREKLEANGILHKTTGLPGKEHFANILDHVANRARISCSPLGLVLVGIQGFDQFEYIYGPERTADGLKVFAYALKRSLKDSQSFVVHRTDDVFAILTHHGSINWVFSFLDELRKNLEGLTIPYRGDCCSMVTAVSGAVLTNLESGPAASKALVAKADEAYEWGQQTGSSRTLML